MNLLASTVALLIAATPCFAEIYQWKDADGHTVFSEKAPLNVEFKIVKPKTTPPSAAAIEKLKKQLAPPAAPVAKSGQDLAAAPAEPTPKEKKANCKTATEVLTRLQNTGRVRQRQENGEVVYLTEEERQQRVKDAQASVAKWCN